MNDDFDLDAIRTFRAADAVPPAGLQERLEETMWQVVLEEEARIRGARSSQRSRAARWLDQLLRPATAIGVAVSIAAVLAVATGSQPIGSGSSGAPGKSPASQAAGVFDSTAASLFGGSAANASANDAAFPSGNLPLRERQSTDEAPVDSGSAASQLPRDPDELLVMLEQSAADATADSGGDPTDRLAFHIAMGWVTDTSVPLDLRASFVRAMGGLDGIDAVSAGSDLFGRQGMILGHLDEMTGVRDQYVLNSGGGQLLERRSFTTSYLDPACPPGTFTGYAAFSDDGDAIAPANAPLLAWPTVIDACDPATSTAPQ